MDWLMIAVLFGAFAVANRWAFKVDVARAVAFDQNNSRGA
jgi:hypothetical protein